LTVEPSAIHIGKPTDYVQIVVTGSAADGQQQDVTRLAQFRASGRRGADHG
jgi:hypothetical protein